MPRNGSGAYSLPEAAFIPNTPISSAAVNSDFSDIAAAITASLARDGQGGMLAVLPLANSGFNYLADPNTGMRRTAADAQAIFNGGVDVFTTSTTGAVVNGNLVVTGQFVVGGGALVPPGLIFPYAGGVAPSGYLVCDGNAYSRTGFAGLFAIIGTIYGAGDGTTTFKVPDLRGRVPAMLDGGTGRLPGITALGGVAGSATNALSQANLPVATLATTIVDPGHIHTVGPSSLTSISYTAGGTSTGNLQTTTATGSPANQVAAINATGITASTALGGAATPVNNVQPSFGIIYIIKT